MKWLGVIGLTVLGLVLCLLLLLEAEISRPYISDLVTRTTGITARFNGDLDIDYYPDFEITSNNLTVTHGVRSADIANISLAFRYTDLLQRRFFPARWQMADVSATMGQQEKSVPITIPTWPDLPHVDQLDWQDITFTDRPVTIQSLSGQIIPDQVLDVSIDGQFAQKPISLNWNQSTDRLQKFMLDIGGLTINANGQLLATSGKPVSFAGPITLSGGDGETALKWPINTDHPIKSSARLKISKEDGIQLTDIDMKSGQSSITGGLTYLTIPDEDKYRVTANLIAKKIPLGDQLFSYIAISGQFTPGKFQLKSLKFGKNAKGGGTVSYDLNQQTMTGDITLSGIDLANLMIPADDPEKSDPKTEPPFPVDQIRGWDGSLAIDANDFRHRGRSIGGIAADFSLTDDRLSWVINNTDAGIAGGSMDITGGYDFGHDPGKFSLDGNITDLRIDPFTTAANDTKAGISAPLSIQSTVTSTGNKLIDLRRNLDGHLNLVVRDGRIINSATDIWVTNIFQTILPSGKGNRVTNLNCAVGRFDLDGGVAQSTIILIDTDQLSIIGDGQIDIGERSLNIALDPRSKSIQLGTLNTGARITGSWDNPSIGPDLIDLSSTVGSLIFGIANPIGLILPLVDLGLIENDPCEEVLAAD